MQLVTVEFPLPIVQGRNHHSGEFRALQIQRSAGTAGQAIGKKRSMRWKTAVQTERNKQRLIDSVPVRESPFSSPHPQDGVWAQEQFSENPCREPPERRLRLRLAAPHFVTQQY
jgi:hypothetical protein